MAYVIKPPTNHLGVSGYPQENASETRTFHFPQDTIVRDIVSSIVTSGTVTWTILPSSMKAENGSRLPSSTPAQSLFGGDLDLAGAGVTRATSDLTAPRQMPLMMPAGSALVATCTGTHEVMILHTAFVRNP